MLMNDGVLMMDDFPEDFKNLPNGELLEHFEVEIHVTKNPI